MNSTVVVNDLRSSLKLLVQKCVESGQEYVLEAILPIPGTPALLSDHTIKVASKNGDEIYMDHLAQELEHALYSVTILTKKVNDDEFSFFFKKEKVYGSILATYTGPERNRVYISFN